MNISHDIMLMHVDASVSYLTFADIDSNNIALQKDGDWVKKCME